MHLNEPHKIYTAETNVEALLIVELLVSNGIAAFVEEDQSGVSLWAFGTLSQFHQPNVWVEKSSATVAADLIRQFETKKQDRARSDAGDATIAARCEECERESTFPKSLDGTVQDCPHCGAYMDIGELPWDDDYDRDSSGEQAEP